MKYLYTISLCLIFVLLGNASITNAQVSNAQLSKTRCPATCPRGQQCIKKADGDLDCRETATNCSPACTGSKVCIKATATAGICVDDAPASAKTQQLQAAPQVGLNCGNRACSPPFICINRGGQPQCVKNEAEPNGDCRGDSTFKCPARQACVKDSSGELGCEAIFLNNNLQDNAPANQQDDVATPAGGNNPTGLLDGLNVFKDANSGLNTGTTLIGYVANIIRWILGLLGTVFFVIVVLQGYIYMTAGGDSNKTATAIGAIGNAVVGLLIIMGAFLITNFVTSGLINSGG